MQQFLVFVSWSLGSSNTLHFVAAHKSIENVQRSVWLGLARQPNYCSSKTKKKRKKHWNIFYIRNVRRRTTTTKNYAWIYAKAKKYGGKCTLCQIFIAQHHEFWCSVTISSMRRNDVNYSKWPKWYILYDLNVNSCSGIDQTMPIRSNDDNSKSKHRSTWINFENSFNLTKDTKFNRVLWTKLKNNWKRPKILENSLKCSKMFKNVWKYLEIVQHSLKCSEIFRKVRKKFRNVLILWEWKKMQTFSLKILQNVENARKFLRNVENCWIMLKTLENCCQRLENWTNAIS